MVSAVTLDGFPFAMEKAINRVPRTDESGSPDRRRGKGGTVVEGFPMQEADAVFEWLKDGCIRSRAVLYNDVA